MNHTFTKTPGERPGSSAWRPDAYARPSLALGIAGAGYLATVAILFLWAVARGALAGIPAALPTMIVAVLTSVPLLIAVWVGGSRAGAASVARATGIRSWKWMDVVLGAAAGLGMRSIIEFVSPTTGSLGGPFGAADAVTVAVVVMTAVVVSPLVEELFFRGLVARSLADAFAGAGVVIAAIVSIVVSTAAFVGLHVVTLRAEVPLSLVLSAALVGLVCGILTLATGRLGAAIVAHALSNLIGVALLAV